MKIFLFNVFVSLFAFTALAQPPSKDSNAFEVGAAAFNDKDAEIASEGFRAFASLGGIKLPGIGDLVSTGALVEVGYESGKFVYDVWSSNRSGIGRVIIGADLRLTKNSSLDFDYRIVTGYKLTDSVSGYVYLLDERVPAGFALSYSF